MTKILTKPTFTLFDTQIAQFLGNLDFKPSTDPICPTPYLDFRIFVYHLDLKHWVTSPNSKVVGSNLRFLGYRFNHHEFTLQKSDNSNASDERKGREWLTWFFREIMANKPSDIYISPDNPVVVQIKGRGLFSATLECLDNTRATLLVTLLTGDPTIFSLIANRQAVSGLAEIGINAEHQGRKLKGLRVNKIGQTEEVDLSHTLNDISEKMSFRYQLKGCITKSSKNSFMFTLRPLEQMPKSYDQLGIELNFVQDCIKPDGIVVVAGATGQGKSTTLSAIIRYILEHDTIIKGCIVTLEDPIEMRYDKIQSEHSNVWQTQIGSAGHLLEFSEGIKSAMRESPKLIVVGELRDRSSMMSAIEASLTGHTVFTTTHATDVGSIMPRLISQVPQEKIVDLLNSIQVLSAQRLFRDVNNNVRTMREWLTFTTPLKNKLFEYVTDPNILVSKIREIMENELFGAKNFKTQADELLSKGIISEFTHASLCVKESLTADELALIDKL